MCDLCYNLKLLSSFKCNPAQPSPVKLEAEITLNWLKLFGWLLLFGHPIFAYFKPINSQDRTN